MKHPSYETLEVERYAHNPAVLHVRLNRPDQRNAMNTAFWRECRECFQRISFDDSVRCVVVSGNGKLFTAGLDLTDSTIGGGESDPARKSFNLRRKVMEMQDAFTAIELCKQPVIAAIHSACIGGGVDLVCACDIRYCTKDAYFSIKEVDVGLAADVGTLQRMPKVMGSEGLIRELAYTGRKFPADEARQTGFVNLVLDNKELLLAASLKLADEIAQKSPVAIYGTKRFLNYSRDHTVADGLEYAATWNSAMLNTEDLPVAIQASMAKTKPTFSKL